MLMSYQNCGGFKTGASSGASLSASGASALSQANNGDLLGTWVSGCALVTGSTSTMKQVSTYEFSGSGNYLIKQMYFSTADCSGAGLYSMKITGSFKYNGDSSTVSGAKLFSSTPDQTLLLTVNDSTYLNAFNSYNNNAGICGVQWSLNTPQTVTTSATCLTPLNPSSNELFEITNQMLYFGNQGNTALDMATPYSFVSSATADIK